MFDTFTRKCTQNYTAAYTISRSALCTDEIARNFDKHTHTKKASGIHTDKDLAEDVTF